MKARQSLRSGSMAGLAIFFFIVIPLAAQAGVQTAVVVDGEYDEWDLDRDDSHPMPTTRTCKGQNGRQCTGEQVPNVYLRYDSIANIVFVLVLQKDGVRGGTNKPVVNIYSLGQNIPVNINGAGKVSNFSWVMNGGNRVGWEGSFQPTPGTYNCDTALNTLKGTKTGSESKKASEVKVLDTEGLFFKCD